MLVPDEHLRKLMKQGHSFHEAVQMMCLGTDDTPMSVIHNGLETHEDSYPDPNIRITEDELALVRRLSDFDLTMLLSDIDQHRWRMARRTLWLMWEQPEYQKPEKRRRA